MPRAAGPFKVLEKINDNASKLELPPEFGVSLTSHTWVRKISLS
jgi:hypothetical protein